MGISDHRCFYPGDGFHDSVGDIYTTTGSNDGSVTGGYSRLPRLREVLASEELPQRLRSHNRPGRRDHRIQQPVSRFAARRNRPGRRPARDLTLGPGIYQAEGGSFLITGADLTLDGGGDPNAVLSSRWRRRSPWATRRLAALS